MKKIIITIAFSFGFLTSSFAQEISACEKDLNTSIKPVLTNSKWQEPNNSYKYGPIQKKNIEYVGFVNSATQNGYSTSYNLSKMQKNGYYFFGMLGEKSNPAYFYDNEKDAARALYVWERCRVVLEKGRVEFDQY